MSSERNAPPGTDSGTRSERRRVSRPGRPRDPQHPHGPGEIRRTQGEDRGERIARQRATVPCDEEPDDEDGEHHVLDEAGRSHLVARSAPAGIVAAGRIPTVPAPHRRGRDSRSRDCRTAAPGSARPPRAETRPSVRPRGVQRQQGGDLLGGILGVQDDAAQEKGQDQDRRPGSRRRPLQIATKARRMVAMRYSAVASVQVLRDRPVVPGAALRTSAANRRPESGAAARTASELTVAPATAFTPARVPARTESVP